MTQQAALMSASLACSFATSRCEGSGVDTWMQHDFGSGVLGVLRAVVFEIINLFHTKEMGVEAATERIQIVSICLVKLYSYVSGLSLVQSALVSSVPDVSVPPQFKLFC